MENPEIYNVTHLVSRIDSLEPTGACLVAMTLSGEMIGSLGLRLGGPGAFINSLFVKQDWQGQGVGRALLCQAVDLSRNYGKQCIGLTVHQANSAARHLYGSLGFVPYGEGRAKEYIEYVHVLG